MRFHRILTIIAVLMTTAACGPKDLVIASSAQATSSSSQHPLVGTWLNTNGGQDLVVQPNGTTISQGCGTQGTVGEVEDGKSCGTNSKSCGSFPYIVIGGSPSPACIEAGSFICYYNVFTSSGQDYLWMNCSDGKGVSYYTRKP